MCPYEAQVPRPAVRIVEDLSSAVSVLGDGYQLTPIEHLKAKFLFKISEDRHARARRLSVLGEQAVNEKQLLRLRVQEQGAPRRRNSSLDSLELPAAA